MLYSDVEMDLVINGDDMKVTADFDYQPFEKQTRFSPSTDPSYEFSSVRLIANKKVIDLMDADYSWLITDDIEEQLNDLAEAHIEFEVNGYEAQRCDFLSQQRVA